MKKTKAIAGSLVLVIIYTYILIFIKISGWETAWRQFSIPSMYPYFADVRSIPGAIESIRQGYNPYIHNPGDPWNRVLNYPPVWIKLAKILNWNNSISLTIFIILIILAFIGIIIFLAFRYNSFFIAFTGVSSAILLAIERGNNDLVIFDMTFLALIQKSLYISIALISLTVILKIYPVFTVFSISKNAKHFLVVSTLFVTILMLYFDYIEIIGKNTLTSVADSYGLLSTYALFSNYFDFFEFSNFRIAFVLFSIILIIIFLTCFPAMKLHGDLLSKNLFMAGSGIYLSTYIFGNNFDYRMIFVILCLPMIVINFNKIALILIELMIFVSMSYYYLTRLMTKDLAITINQSSKIVLFIFLLYLFANQLTQSDIYFDFIKLIKDKSKTVYSTLEKRQ